MTINSLLEARGWARLAALLVLLLSGLALRPPAARATHLRGGDIRVTLDTTAGAPANSLRVFFRMIIYTNNKSPAHADKATIFFGDGTSSCENGIPRKGPEIPYPLNPDVSVNIFEFEHTYPLAGDYIVQYVGENRNADVRNMSNSSSQTFYIATAFTLNPSLAHNHSPALRAPAVDDGAVGQVFTHNPGAYDADGDSLVYVLAPSRQVVGGVMPVLGPPCPRPAPGNNLPVPATTTNFHYPNDPIVTFPNVPVQVAYAGPPVGRPGDPAIFVMDPISGNIVWNAPALAGQYNVAMEIQEWRRYPRHRVLKIGTVIRDLQITVVSTPNLPPLLVVPPDLCVIANQTARGEVTATDGVGPNSPATPITLFAYAGILPSPASFVQTQTGPPIARGTFVWNTNCLNVAREPYQVVFKAQDNPIGASAANPPLVDIRPWRIKVVGPAPRNLQATPVVGTGGNPNSMHLTWITYDCGNADSISIYRKVGPSGFVPSACVTGIPPSAGYTFLKKVGKTVNSFDDNNVDATGTVRGLMRGVNYCYRIFASFPGPAFGESIASNEACNQIPGRATMLTKVDVLTTSATAGQVQVCWTQPRTGTAQPFSGALSYKLYRAEGLNPAAATFTRIATLNSLTDTCYTDGNLNTLARQYLYRVDFERTLTGGVLVTEASEPASSVRLRAVPRNAGRATTISWTFNVPWNNTARPTIVYRKGPAAGSPFVRVGTAASTATGGSYADNDPALVKDEEYCYYVLTVGRYAGFAFLDSLPNRSQQQCVLLSAPPCTPRLTLLQTNCDSLAGLPEFPRQGQYYTNRLRWTTGTPGPDCDPRAPSYYNVFYRPTPAGSFRLIGTSTTTSYLHADNLAFSGGCYAVQAVAANTLVSDTSNVACQDNCLFFRLPNIFTPNGDAQNAVFRPKNYSPIRSIHFQAYNRWGVKVFENTTTTADRVFINWDGGGSSSETGTNRRVSDGVYYYLAKVEFADKDNTTRTYKGWVEIVR